MKRATALAAVSAGLVLSMSAPAQAGLDQGNNDAACSSTEICFSEYSSNWGQSHKDFWNAANHYTVVPVSGQSVNEHAAYTFNAGTSFTRHEVIDSASGIWNRDSSCSVRLWDVDGVGGWNIMQTYARGTSSWVALSSYGNKNNGHSRCTEGAPKYK